MSILMLLIPLSVALLGVVGVALFWAVHSGQFDTGDEQALQVVLDDDTPVAR